MHALPGSETIPVPPLPSSDQCLAWMTTYDTVVGCSRSDQLMVDTLLSVHVVGQTFCRMQPQEYKLVLNLPKLKVICSVDSCLRYVNNLFPTYGILGRVVGPGNYPNPGDAVALPVSLASQSRNELYI
jgi:hypothetical protein